MTGYELLSILIVPVLFLAAGGFAYFIAVRESDRFDASQKNRQFHAH